jgi:hypothetical protein
MSAVRHRLVPARRAEMLKQRGIALMSLEERIDTTSAEA